MGKSTETELNKILWVSHVCELSPHAYAELCLALPIEASYGDGSVKGTNRVLFYPGHKLIFVPKPKYQSNAEL